LSELDAAFVVLLVSSGVEDDEGFGRKSVIAHQRKFWRNSTKQQGTIFFPTQQQLRKPKRGNPRKKLCLYIFW